MKRPLTRDDTFCFYLKSKFYFFSVEWSGKYNFTTCVDQTHSGTGSSSASGGSIRTSNGGGSSKTSSDGPVVVGGSIFDFVVRITEDRFQTNGSTHLGKLQYRSRFKNYVHDNLQYVQYIRIVLRLCKFCSA